MARLRQTAAPASTLPLREPISSSGRRRFLIFLVVFGLALSLFPTDPPPAWGAGLLDRSFNPGSGAQLIPIVKGKVDYPDGRALIFGRFGWYNGTAGGYCYSLARLNADGNLDTSFIPTFSPLADIRCAALLSSGQILIGGVFSISSGSSYYYNLVRLNSDGAVDATFSNIIGNQGPVNALGVQSDDKILVGGWGIAVSGDNTHAYHLLRLQSNGSLDTVYPKRDAAGYVHSIEILNDPFELPDRARILGSLPNASNFNNDYLLTLDSYGNTQWSLGDETVNGPILAMVRQADGMWVIGGQFSQVLGTACNGVARLSPSLTLDPFFNQGGSGAGGGPVTSLLLQGNKIVAGGHFTSFNGAGCGFLVRLKADGKPDSTFTPGSGANDPLFSITAAGGGLVICGAFRSYNGIIRNGIASLSADGVLGSQYNSFSSMVYYGSVFALAVQADGKVLVGGDFTGMDGKYHHGLARLHANGSVDPSFRAGVDGWVKNIALQPDGKILLAGRFGQANSYSRTSLARLNPDGSMDLTFNPVIQSPIGVISELWQVVRLSTGKIMIAGNLNSVNGLTRIGVARLDSSGFTDNSFNPQITLSGGGVGSVTAIAESAGGYVVVGFGIVQGISNRGFLTRLTNTGSMDATFGPTGSTPSPHAVIFRYLIYHLFLQTDNRIVVGGSFNQIIDGSPSPPPRNYLARFTADGMLDGTLTTNPGASAPVYWMAPQTDGRIIIGGGFATYDAAARHSIARVKGDGSLDTSFYPGAGAAGAVYIVLPPVDGCALIGGNFAAYDNTARGSLARIMVGSPPTAASLLLLSD